MGRGPSFSAPGGRPGGGGGGGAGRPNLGGGAGSVNRPNPGGGGNINRPNIGGGNVNRPNIGGGGNNVNRPNIGGGGNTVNRPNIGGGGNNVNRPNIGGGGNNVNRPNIGGNNVNRPNFGGNTVNRPNFGGNTVNRPNFGGNTNINRTNNGGNVNINNRPNVNNITRINNNNFVGINNRPGYGGGFGRPGYGGGFGRPGYGGGFGRPGFGGGGYYGRPGYWGGFSNAYHGGWVNGYWHGHNNAGWNNFGTGFGLGLATWGLGTSLYNWGYSSYSNPYYVAVPQTQTIVVQQPVPYDQPTVTPSSFDYSRPYDLDAPPPDQTTADASVDIFDNARAAFKEGNYAQALTLTDQAIAKLPNDTSMQEFRALVLFALRDYDRAAAVLYSVLSVGPGWDWTTLISLYSDIEAYTADLRALEGYRDAHPDSASALFVLAYQYMTAGNTDAAAKEFERVVQLKPSDRLSAGLAKRLTAPSADAEPEPAAAALSDTPPADPQPPAGAASTPDPKAGSLPGTWVATPAEGVTITLAIKAEGGFTWAVKEKEGNRSFTGTQSLGNGILTLAASDGSPMVGKLTWKDDNQFNFKVLGGGDDDPGLTFKKSG